MGKKKKHKNKVTVDFIKSEIGYEQIDETISEMHKEACEKLKKMQKYIKKKDKKTKKKSKQRNGLIEVFNPVEEMQETRKKVLHKMRRGNLLDIVEEVFRNMYPIVKVISRLVASLITLIFQCPMDHVISKKTMKRLNGIHKIALAI